MDTRDDGPEGPEFTLDAACVDAVRLAGGLPWLLPPGAPGPVLTALDALLIPGGAFDIHPRHYGEAAQARLDTIKEDRTALELWVARHALAHHLPVLGLCGGMQVLNVASGGSLVQDLPEHPSHEQPTDPAEPWHMVATSGRLAALLGPSVPVNSTHHQAVRRLGEGFVTAGVSPDGVVEAIEHTDHPFAIGVQWHPERLGDARLFVALVTAARHLQEEREAPPTGSA